MRDEIFISHRRLDASFADLIKDFLIKTGIPNDKVFCSSLPGNDVNEKIEPEVKNHLQKAAIIILLLTKDFYKSAYCLSEAGVAWYLDDVSVIPIGLPEINQENMYGFLSSDYRLRRLDNAGDISYLYDKAQERLTVKNAPHSVITQETEKLIRQYQRIVEDRTIIEESRITDEIGFDDDIWVDGYHKVVNGDGIVLKEGIFENGHLIDGTEFNRILYIEKGTSTDDFIDEEKGEPITIEEIRKGEDYHFSDIAQYGGWLFLTHIANYVEEQGLEFFYVADKNVIMKGKQIVPTYVNIRTLESVLAEYEPDKLDEIKTGVKKYQETETAYFDLGDE